jgi:hypothetical protein
LHIAFYTPERAEVDAFWKAGRDAGYRSDGEPGLRPHYSPDYYGAFLLDPDGNSIEAVTHDSAKERGAIDHIWMRVATSIAPRPPPGTATTADRESARSTTRATTRPSSSTRTGTTSRSSITAADGRP